MKLTNNTFKMIIWVIFIIYIGIMVKLLVVQSSPRGIIESMKMATIPEVERRIKQGNYIPLNTISKYIIGDENNTQDINKIARNLILYIPLGFFIPILIKTNRDFSNLAMAVITFSVTFALVKIIGGFGVFNIDELILNTLGGIIGFIIYAIGARLYKI